MTDMTIRGITWDHPRGYAPLAGSIEAYRSVRPDVTIVWDKRSLKAFGEAPIDDLADRYDLVVVDHPFCGRAASSGCLKDLRPIMGKEFIEDSVQDSVGQSAQSYHYGGGVWGLPTDAAAQVAAYRPDILDEAGVEVPRTLDDVLDLAGKLRAKGKCMAVPAVPTDAFCMVLTFLAGLDHPVTEEGSFGDLDLVTDVLEKIVALVSECTPKSLSMNPIAVLEAMSSTDEIGYVPYVFGYSNYSRIHSKRLIRFADIAGPGADPRKGSLLGGAGCAMTRSCENVEEVAAYLKFLHNPDYQKGRYFEDGGQPGSQSAWADPLVNGRSANFFSGTIETLTKAYVRPRFDGFIDFFEASGDRVNAFLRDGGTAKDVARELIVDYGMTEEKR